MKKSIALLLVLILTIGILPFGVLASENIYVTVDGATLNFDQPPIMQNDRVLVPMRLIFETLGATVEWDEYNQYVKATKDDISITMQIGNNTMVKNGQYITLDTAPILLNGRTLVPVRAVAESLEATVEWRGEINTVVIEQKVIPKRYATETVVYAPDAKSIITDKDNNIYYIQDNKVMIYKNGIASVFVDVDKKYDNFEFAEVGREKGFISSIVYDFSNNCIIGNIDNNGMPAAMATINLTTGEVLRTVKNEWAPDLCLLDQKQLYGFDFGGSSYAPYFSRVNLSTGQGTEIKLPEFQDSLKYIPFSLAVIDSKITFLVIDNYNIYYCQYNLAKNDYDTTNVLNSDILLENLYIGTDGINFYYILDSDIYQVTPTKQVKLWLSNEEIDYQDQTAIYQDNGSDILTFDQEGNILFYDANVKSIRRIKKLN
ncbi:stalk domain-containing protein [Ructibacterium gallinarum]|uniref:Copper amine oxidase-like N-terminal domain-containing protein n=1 Tax=Ructibacterium gallinarum TaxID=2779355 RepID=A0A9D5M7V4_9FIRM|nr:stalk domain-containing protein [Ructibacterium gallinarum]MBE5041164.1 hypothetical protein [Ructibacterium gallinarum]